MSYRIVPFESIYLDQVLALQQYLWGPDRARNAAYFDWKYVQNPFADEPLVHLALAGDQLVGMRGKLCSRWQAGTPAEELACLSEADAVVHPDHRRRGLFREMTATALDDPRVGRYRFIINLSSNEASSGGYAKLGWQPVLVFEELHRKERPAFEVLRFSRKVRPFRKLDARMGRRRGAVAVHRVARPDEMSHIVERIPHDGRMRPVRNRDYLAWRFGNPLASYRFLYWEDPEPLGYLVLQAEPFRYGVRVHIVDWEGVDPHVRSGLLTAAVRWGGFPDLHVWREAVPALAGATLEDAGFRPRRKTGFRSRVLLRATDDSDAYTVAGVGLMDPDSWDLRLAYSDGF